MIQQKDALRHMNRKTSEKDIRADGGFDLVKDLDPRNQMRFPDVVAVDVKEAIRPASFSDADVTRLTQLAPPVAVQSNDSNDRISLGKFAHDRDAVVGRTIVDKNDFESIVELFSHAAYRLEQRPSHVVIAYADGIDRFHDSP